MRSDRIFADTDNKSVAALFTMGIINGKNATEFAPNDYLTREEAATIIVRMVNKIVPMAATEMWFEYDDINEVSEWASDYIQTISNLGFMNGVGNNKFAPKETYTTEQAIVEYASYQEFNNDEENVAYINEMNRRNIEEHNRNTPKPRDSP